MIVVIYDSSCEFCRWSMEWLKKRDKNSVLRFLPCQSEERAKEFPKINEAQCLGSLQVVLPDKRIKAGFDGVAYIMRFLPGYRLLGLIFSLPGIKSLGRIGYRWVAQNRFRIKCE